MMALLYLITWLAAFFLCVLAGFRGWLYVSSLSILSLLTDVPRQNDRCKKRARQLRHLPQRFYISLAWKLPVWMHTAMCIVGFLSFTVLIWLILIYAYARPFLLTAWQSSSMYNLPQHMLFGCLPDSAPIGSCRTSPLRAMLLSTSCSFVDAKICTQTSSGHTPCTSSFLLGACT